MFNKVFKKMKKTPREIRDLSNHIINLKLKLNNDKTILSFNFDHNLFNVYSICFGPTDLDSRQSVCL